MIAEESTIGLGRLRGRVSSGKRAHTGNRIHENAATFTLIIPGGITSIKVLAFHGVKWSTAMCEPMPLESSQSLHN